MDDSDLDKMRHREEIIRKLAEVFKCKPDEVMKKVQQHEERMRRAGEILKQGGIVLGE